MNGLKVFGQLGIAETFEASRLLRGCVVGEKT
jgi:hypothetical protein